MPRNITDTLLDYMDCFHSVFFINHNNPHILDELFAKASEDDVLIEVYDGALGWLNHDTPDNKRELARFLAEVHPDGFEGRLFLVLYDIDAKTLSRRDVTALLRRIAINAASTEGFDVTAFILSPFGADLPSLQSFVTYIDVPPPDRYEIEGIIARFANDMDIHIYDYVIRELAFYLCGLDEFKINRVLASAYQNGGDITLSDKDIIIAEKRRAMIRKNNLFTYIDNPPRYDDIGGLYTAMNYLKEISRIFKDPGAAEGYGADMPRGILITGAAGCGKGLIAAAAADLFGLPLVRVDAFERISQEDINLLNPCVLLIKNRACDFLSLTDKITGIVFIVAITDDTSKIGCVNYFDEVFFVSLPNFDERREILQIHLMKRKQITDNINLSLIAQVTEGLSGAQIENAVRRAVYTAFADGRRKVTTGDLQNAAAISRKTVSIKPPTDIDFIYANAKVKAKPIAQAAQRRAEKTLFKKTRWLPDRRFKAERRIKPDRRKTYDAFFKEDAPQPPREQKRLKDPLMEAIESLKTAEQDDDLTAFFKKLEGNSELI